MKYTLVVKPGRILTSYKLSLKDDLERRWLALQVALDKAPVDREMLVLEGEGPYRLIARTRDNLWIVEIMNPISWSPGTPLKPWSAWMDSVPAW